MPALLSERKCSKAKRKNNPDKSGTKSGTDSDQDRLSQQDIIIIDKNVTKSLR